MWPAEPAELRQIFDAAPVGIVLRRGRTILYVNDWAAQCFGSAPAALRGRDLAELFDAEARPTLVQRWTAIDGGEERGPIEARFLRSDGRVGTMELSPSRRVRFDGELAALLLLRDLTEEKQLRERLLMSDRLLAVGTLAAGVAHEINNPLACVTANLEVLDEELAAAERDPASLPVDDLRSALSDAREGAERVRLIVRDLRLFARNDDREHGPVQLRDAVEVAERMTAGLLRGRAQLVKEVEDLPPVAANAPRLAQVFVNLFINAAQSIDAGAPEANAVRVTGRLAGDRLLVEVRDSGRGMSDEMRRRVFDPFFSARAAGGGHGLGLAVCHGIMHGLGGDISVDSAPGAGSTFHLTLPVARMGE